MSPASPAFPTAPNVSFSFVGSNSPPQSLNLPACVPQAAVVNASLTCQEFRASPPNFLRQFNLRCPALAAGPNRPPQGPVSAAISGTVGQGTPAQATITVSDQDNDQLTARIKQQGNNGVCSVTTAATGAFLVTYVPGANVSGALSDTCIVEIADGRGGLLNVTVTVGLAANVPIGALNPTVQAAVMQDPIAGPAAAANQANCASSSDATVLAQCAAISAATDPATVVAVLRAITGEEASSQVTSSQDSANFVNQGVTGRLGALHGGVRSTLDDVALNFNGKQIPMSALASVLGWQAADEQDAPGGLLDNRLSGFLTGTIRNGERDESGFEVGFDYDGIQVVGGMDYRFSERFVGGAALGYGKVETELGRNAGALDTKTLSGTLYGSYLPSDRLYLDFALGLLKNDYDQQRTIDLSALGGNFRRTVAISNTRGKQISLSSSVGYNFSRGATSITPNARISHARTDIDGYSEFGGGINDLVYPEQDFKSLQFSLGVNLSHAISTSRGVIQPYTNLEFSREQKNDAFSFVPRLRVRPTQSSTPIFIEASDRAFGRAEFGLLFLTGGGWQISTSYTQILGYEDLTARSFQLIGRREF